MTIYGSRPGGSEWDDDAARPGAPRGGQPPGYGHPDTPGPYDTPDVSHDPSYGAPYGEAPTPGRDTTPPEGAFYGFGAPPGRPAPPSGEDWGPPAHQRAAAAPPPPLSTLSPPPSPSPRRRPILNRTTIIIAALVAVLVGAGTAGAATFMSGNDTGNKPAAGPTTAAPGATSGAPASPTPPAGEPISMSATGDIVMGMAPGGLPPNNGKGFFSEVQPLLKADFQMGNLEQTITDNTGVGKCSAADTAKGTCYAFRTPPATVGNLKDAGFHLVNMANNHAYDFGPAGYKNTQAALDSVGIKYTGWPGLVTVVDVKGVKVAVVGFASYTEWSNLCSDLPAATKIITTAAGQADIVVVQVHMGAEGASYGRVRPGTEIFLGENRCDPIAFSHTVIDAGADLVVGHGPHVVRGMEFYKGRLIAYSLGNFAGYRALSYNGVVGVTAVIRVNLNRDGSWASGTLICTHMIAPGLPRPDPKKQAITAITSLTKQDFPQTGAKIASDGTLTP